MSGLRLVYGPQNLQQAGAVLNEIKMEKNIQHLSTPQPAIEYCTRFDTALLWISDIGQSEKAIIKIFIKGVQPSHLARELELREFKEFKKLKYYFAKTYFENYQSYLRLRAAVGLFSEDYVPKKKSAGAAAGAAGANKPSAPAAAAATTSKWSQASTGEAKASPAKQEKGSSTPIKEIFCWHCNEKGHRASDCPKKAAASPNTKTSSMSPVKTTKAVSFQTPPSKQNGSVLRQDLVIKRCDACCFIGVPGDQAPTLAI